MNENWLASTISDSVRGGKTPEQARDHLLLGGFERKVVDAAFEIFFEQTGRIRKVNGNTVLVKPDIPQWYVGPNLETDAFWPPLRKYLLHDKRWDEDVVDSVDEASTQVLSLMEPAGRASIETRGLVLGYVQSGKTANFTALIAKAADVGYRLFIVLSGMHNSLREQTQLRLNAELIELNRQSWAQLTDLGNDFHAGAAGNTDAFLSERTQLRILCVVKKNGHVLRRLLKWLQKGSRPVLSACPVLVIDDEADQASINTSRNNDRTAINGLIMDILETCPKAAYVGYTATPFANVLIDPSQSAGLYPRHFILSLPEPEGYFGATQIFGREPLDHEEPEDLDCADMVRPIDDDEVAHLKPDTRKSRDTFVPDVTPSLAEALRYFWMSCAARVVRGQNDRHMSMLVHTSLYVTVHGGMVKVLSKYKDWFIERVRRREGQTMRTLREQWMKECEAVPAKDMGEQPVSFDELVGKLEAVVGRTLLVEDNGQSDNRLDFSKEARIQIAVGGNTLSRGLTIEGLCVSYFIRASTMYDTLLQMGRWFGYRRGYSDLTRIWMTDELQEAFRHLATVETEIRGDVQRYSREALTPLDFGVRVRTHPKLAVTARLKMQSAVVCDLSYSDSTIQTTFFHHRDQAWLMSNLGAANQLLKQASQVHRTPEKIWDRHFLWRDVPAEHVLEFLETYQIHQVHEGFRREHLRGYIQEQNAAGQLKRWNLGVISQKRDTAPKWDGLVPDQAVRLLQRSKLIRTGDSPDTVSLGAIMTTTDRGIDLKLSESDLKKIDRKDLATSLAATRNKGQGADDRMPLLLLYPINKSSQSHSSRRASLNATDHIVGLGLVFPKARRDTPQKYMTADLSKVPREEFDFIDEEENNP